MTALAFSGEARHHAVLGIALTVAGHGPLIDNRRAWAARGAVPLSAAHLGACTPATHEWHRHTPTRTGGALMPAGEVSPSAKGAEFLGLLRRVGLRGDWVIGEGHG